MNATAGATRPKISRRWDRLSELERRRDGSAISLPAGAGSVGVMVAMRMNGRAGRRHAPPVREEGPCLAARLGEQAVGLLGRFVELLLHLGVAVVALRGVVEDVAEAPLVGVLDARPLRDRGVRATLLDRLE